MNDIKFLIVDVTRTAYFTLYTVHALDGEVVLEENLVANLPTKEENDKVKLRKVCLEQYGKRAALKEKMIAVGDLI